MQKIIILLLALLALGVTANAATVWDPANNPVPILPPDAGNWGDPNNWTNGVPGVVDQKSVFNVADAAECQVTTDTPVFSDIYGQGDGGPGGVVRVMDGGTITQTGGWMAVGYNSPAKLIVEEGGVADFGGHLWLGMHTGADGIVEINGGTMYGRKSFGLGEWFGTVGDHGQCKVYINSGELNIHHWSGSIGSANPVFWGDSLIDIRDGKMVINNDSATAAQEYIDAGKITGFGGAGTVEVVFADGVTTITATNPMDPWPVDTTIEAGDVELSWTNLDPNNPADPVYVDVWFGTDPNKLTLNYTLKVDAVADANSVVVNAPVLGDPPTTYYWQADSYIWGPDHINEPNMIEGDVWSFNVTNDFPPEVVDAGLNMITWIGKLTPVDANVVDDGASDLTIAWSADPADGVVFSATDAEDPDVTFPPRRTVAKGIQVQNDDAEEHINAAFTGVAVGNVSRGSSDLELGSDGDGGLDWQVIAIQYDTLGIPKEAIVTSAKITFQVQDSGETGASNDFTILAETADDAVPLASEPNNITDRARSAASVPWAPAAGPSVGTKIDTPDITALIQEVVDQAGWSEDNRLTLMIYPDVYLALSDPNTGGTTTLQEIEFESGPGSDAPTLTVTYEIPGGSPAGPGSTTYTLTLVVHDEFNTTPIESTMTVDVYETPCYAAIAAGEGTNYPADSNGDCVIGLADFAAMIAPYWADDYALTVPIPQ